ncbi:MAG: S-layer homology domain-containing protein [Oscillatoriales cyanobacterium RM2_1_1]|nr:S-layer homology domain-containing protein [Oscillatoriales cyanobacterium SM2_3_0]NJO45366.1 S-layer homology domain-containing protein [Oscillatoriales cyanobacterium RM2_1_1]
MNQLLRKTTQSLGLGIALVSVLSACANSPKGQSLEESLKADPQLASSTTDAQTDDAQTKPAPTADPILTVSLPLDFPSEIPIYPGAQLLDVNSPGQNSQSATTRWRTQDPSNAVQTYYRNQFRDQNWEVTRRPVEEGEGTFLAEKDNLQITVALNPDRSTSGQTEFEVSYQQSVGASPLPLPPGSLPPTSSPTPGPAASPTTTPTTTPTETSSSSGGSGTVPADLLPFVQDVTQAGLLISPQGSKSASDNTLSSPNSSITRGEYARWLVNANNNFYSKTPAKQVRGATPTSKPVFTDVPPSHPYFSEIQGLAEAGLIPSSLSGDSTVTQFRPDASLTREDLVLWKVPLDTRQALPKATVDTVKERWGFQDASKIDARALGAVLADFDNGDNANIRRAYGFTTLFQPKKPVTRSEAAATLWYFGFQGDGISAAELAQGKQLPTN